MIRLTVVIVLRLAVAAFFLMTAAYAVLNCSPFAFDTFIRPQLFPWLTRFVGWHHLWFCAAYLVSVVTLVPELRGRRGQAASTRRVYWLAVGYVLSVGFVAARLVVSPYLPTLWNDGRALPTAIIAFLPILWLAVIDHVAVQRRWSTREVDGPDTLGQRRLLVTCAGFAAYVWSVHLVRAIVVGDRSGSAAGWGLTAVWALAQTGTIAAIVYTLLGLVAGVAARTRHPRRNVRLHGCAVCSRDCELLRRLVLPTVSLPALSAALVAAVAGMTVAAVWSGFTLRRAALRPSSRGDSGTALLLAPEAGTATVVVALVILPLLAASALGRVERMDWVFVAQRLIVVAAWTVAFGLLLRLTRRVSERPWSVRTAVFPPAAALMALWTIPQGAALIAASSGDHRLDPSVVFERYAGAETGFSLMADGLVNRAGVDPGYYRFLQVQADPTGAASITVPDVEFFEPRPGPGTSRPDIFLFVIDSLRPDYLSPYNPAVTFTPAIERFAAESFVFRNVFTRHGGTELAMPSILGRRVCSP